MDNRGSIEVRAAKGSDGFAVDGLAGQVLSVGVVAGRSGFGHRQVASVHEFAELVQAGCPCAGLSDVGVRVAEAVPALLGRAASREVDHPLSSAL